MSVGPSVNFCQHFECPWDLPKTFRAATGPTVNFSQLFLQPLEIHSTFLASVGPSVHFPCICRTFCQLPSTYVHARVHLLTFHVSAELSVNFHQLSVQPQDLLPTCVNSLFVSRTFRHLPLTICASMGPSKMFCVPAGLSVNFRQLSVQLRDLQATLNAAAGHSQKLLQLSVRLWYLLQLSVHP